MSFRNAANIQQNRLSRKWCTKDQKGATQLTTSPDQWIHQVFREAQDLSSWRNELCLVVTSRWFALWSLYFPCLGWSSEVLKELLVSLGCPKVWKRTEYNEVQHMIDIHKGETQDKHHLCPQKVGICSKQKGSTRFLRKESSSLAMVWDQPGLVDMDWPISIAVCWPILRTWTWRSFSTSPGRNWSVWSDWKRQFANRG